MANGKETIAADFMPTDDSGVHIEFDTERDEIHIVFPAYRMRKARKELSIRELEKDSGVYEVPRNESFVHYVTKLRSGHRVQLEIIAEAKADVRKALFDRALAEGKKVVPLDSKVRQRRYAETDGAIDTGVSQSDVVPKAESKRVRLA